MNTRRAVELVGSGSRQDFRAAVSCCWTLLFCCLSPGRAAAEDKVDFIRDVHPIFAAHCYRCHGPDEQESGFRLDVRETAFAGGDFGDAAIIRGSAKDSPLFQYVSNPHADVTMPPDERLSLRQIDVLKRWINEGADWPESRRGEGQQTSRTHWAFQPLNEDLPPEVKDDRDVWTPVDRFIIAERERRKIPPNPVAKRQQLIRRVTFDLIGLPPTPTELGNFLADKEPGAFERVVERLLDSSHYGERWGRHWMDVVRYADTAGDSSDFPIPDLFRYRNYIIQSFNEDKPYDQFLREQIAGDLLPYDTPEQRHRQIIATGYVASALRFGNGGPEPYLTIEDNINNLGQGILALTIQCARCHDHKFDPISARDYYALYGIFKSTRYPHPGHEMNRAPVRFVPLIPKNQLDQILAPYEKKLDKIGGPRGPLYKELRESREAEKRAAEDPDFSLPEAHRTPHEIEQEIQAISIEYSAAAADYPVYPKAYAVLDAEPVNAKLQIKGDPNQLGDEVPRGFPEVLGGQTLPPGEAGSGRLQLVDWLLQHPLTARVIVNRVWSWHFGRGLSSSVNDFGVRGEAPTHPRLLDYLAKKLIDGGWSIKDLHREIVLSHTYQLSSAENPDAESKDPENRLWWKFPRRRLEAEELRDAMLFVSGQLDPSMPQQPHPFPPRGTWRFSQHEPFEDVYPTRHRSVYLMTKRQRRHPLLAIFDGADTTVSTGARMTSSTPLQSLYLYNDPFVHAQAKTLANRLEDEDETQDERIRRAYKLTFGRSPSNKELDAGKQFLENARNVLETRIHDPDRRSAEAWAAYARVLFRTNEFIYVD